MLLLFAWNTEEKEADREDEEEEDDEVGAVEDEEGEVLRRPPATPAPPIRLTIFFLFFGFGLLSPTTPIVTISPPLSTTRRFRV